MRPPRKPAQSPKKTTPRKAARLTPARIARKLHDTICQSILGVRCLVSVIERQAPPEATELRKHLKDVDKMLNESSLELRNLIQELRTAGDKDSTGLREAPQKNRHPEPAKDL